VTGTASEHLQAVLTGALPRRESPSGLVRDVLLDILDASGAACGLLAIFETGSALREPAAMAVLGHLPLPAQRILATWRSCPAKQDCRTSSTQSFFFRPIWDGGQLAGVLVLLKPFRRRALESAAEHLRLLAAVVYRQLLRSRLASLHEDLDIVGSSPVFLSVEQRIRCAAMHPDAPVLITGERGCGKELAALAVHLGGVGRPAVGRVAGFRRSRLAQAHQQIDAGAGLELDVSRQLIGVKHRPVR